MLGLIFDSQLLTITLICGYVQLISNSQLVLTLCEMVLANDRAFRIGSILFTIVFAVSSVLYHNWDEILVEEAKRAQRIREQKQLAHEKSLEHTK